MTWFDPKPTTHFDVMLEKVRGALQEYEDDWRAGLANGIEARDRQIDEFNAREPLVLEVIRLSNYYEAVLRGDEIWDGRAPSAQLRDACRKLAEWKP